MFGFFPRFFSCFVGCFSLILFLCVVFESFHPICAHTHASDNNSCEHRMDHSHSQPSLSLASDTHISLVAQSAFASLRRCAAVHSLWYNFALTLKLNNNKNNRRHFNVQLHSHSCSVAMIFADENENDSAEISTERSNRIPNRQATSAFNKVSIMCAQ